MTSTTTMRVYVGTYHKYNSGSIKGAWLDIADYADKDEFMEKCAEIHSDESNAEFMFQDYEGIPDNLISESSISEDVWVLSEIESELGANAYEDFLYFMENGWHGKDDDIETIKDRFDECYRGRYGSKKEFADELASEMGYFDAMEKAGISTNYFDSQAFARDLFMDGYYFVAATGAVFSDC